MCVWWIVCVHHCQYFCFCHHCQYFSQVCGKSFNRMYNLLGHMHLHAGSKPFKCPYCTSKFNLKGNLSRHMKVKHGMDVSPEGQGEACCTFNVTGFFFFAAYMFCFIRFLFRFLLFAFQAKFYLLMKCLQTPVLQNCLWGPENLFFHPSLLCDGILHEHTHFLG